MGQHFKIITPVYNAKNWIGKCIESVKSQTHEDFQQIIIDDNSMDSTSEVAREFIGDDDRFKLISNDKRVGVPLNQKKGVEESKASSEDIIVHLDGDDWFYDNSSLAKVLKVYEETGCWMTYGSYMTTTGEKPVAREYKGHPRQAVIDGWPFSHLRTFKRHLWDFLEEKDWVDAEGNAYISAADVVIFVPILEKIGYDKVRFIDDVLMVYNLSHSNNEHKQNLQDQVRVALDVIRK
jgi:glycosyltransferase involved in cell wall biosynthesis